MYQCQFQILLVLLAFPRPTESDHFTRSRRSDDTTFTSLESLIQQQSTVIQSLQSQLTVTQNRLKEAEARIGSLESSDRDQSTQIAALKEKQVKSGTVFGFWFLKQSYIFVFATFNVVSTECMHLFSC